MTEAEFGGVDIDLLADYIGGALAGTPDESAVAARIADDPAWQAAYDSLGGDMAFVGAELGRLAAEPMPADLAARLDTIFRSADPTAAVSGLPADHKAAGSGLSADHPAASGGSVFPAVDDEAAATPHLALVRGDAAVGDGPSPVREKAAKRTGRRLRFATPIAIAAGVVAFVGFGADYLAGHNADSASDTAGSAARRAESSGGSSAQDFPLAGPQILSSGTDYTLGTLASEPVQTLTSPSKVPFATRMSPPDQVGGADVPALARLLSQAALQACLTAIERENADGTLAVQSVDFAAFDGSPAVVVRFAAGNGEWAWASGASCGTAGDADTLGKVPVG